MLLPRASRTQRFTVTPNPLGGAGFSGSVDLGYGVEGDTGGQPLRFNRPDRFMHLEIALATQPLPSNARPARLGGRRGLLAPGVPGSFQGPYFPNHTRFFFRERGVRYAATLHTFGEPATTQLLGAIIRRLTPVRGLRRPVAPADSTRIPPGATDLVLAGGSVWMSSFGSFANLDASRFRVTRLDVASLHVTSVPGIGDRTVALASDGKAIWATHTRNVQDGGFDVPRLTRIDSASGARVTRRIGDRKDSATSIAVDAGSVWVGLARLGRPLRASILRFDSTTLAVVSRIRLSTPPRALAVSSDAWSIPGHGNRVARIAPGSGAVTEFAVGRAPSAIGAIDDSIWVADEAEGVVRRIDPASGGIRSTTPLGGATFRLTRGATGVWAALPGTGEVVGMDPATGQVRQRIAVGGDPVVAVEVAGSIWVASNSDGWLRRIPLPHQQATSPGRGSTPLRPLMPLTQFLSGRLRFVEHPSLSADLQRCSRVIGQP